MEHLLAVHHTVTKMLDNMNVDACARYKDQSMSRVYAQLDSEDRTCALCDRDFRSTKRLRQHMREAHIGTSPKHQCGYVLF